jgi:hypothetical protein
MPLYAPVCPCMPLSIVVCIRVLLLLTMLFGVLLCHILSVGRNFFYGFFICCYLLFQFFQLVIE